MSDPMNFDKDFEKDFGPHDEEKDFDPHGEDAVEDFASRFEKAFGSGSSPAEPSDVADVVRQQSWPASGPAELEVALDVGRIIVRLAEQDGDEGEVRVEVRHDPAAGTGWAQGMRTVLSFLGSQPHGPDPDFFNASGLAAEAVRATRIEWSEPGRRLVVRSPGDLPLRAVPLAITVSAPPQSRLAARAGAGDVRVTGSAGWAAVRTGSGTASVQAVDGDADVVAGSGDIDLGPVTGRARVRSGSGAVRLAAVGGPTEVKSGSGDITVAEVAADLGVRTGSGDIAVHDARSGRIDLTTGSGGMRIGVHPGTRAELDLSTGSGKARSDLEVGDRAPEQPAVLRVRGRSGSGDVLVTRAAVTA